MSQSTANETRVRFLFDPACPWAWRTSLWMREVRDQKGIDVEWDLLSLEHVNRDNTDEKYTELLKKSRLALRTLALAKQRGGNESIDKLYLALGKARHDRREELDDQEVLKNALNEAGLDETLLSEAESHPELDAELEDRYEAAESTGAFGVPTLYFDQENTPYFGPVIDPVPQGEQAIELWNLVYGIGRQPYFYELKRSRS